MKERHLLVILIVIVALFIVTLVATESGLFTKNVGMPKTTVSDKGENGTPTGMVKTGLGTYTYLSSSFDAGSEAGVAEEDTYVCGLMTDEAGLIIDIYFDCSQSKISFNDQGAIISDVKGVLKSKQELKDSYGLVVSSAIGKEWYEQANYFADYCRGKNVSEITGLVMDESRHFTEPDLLAGITVKVDAFMMALIDAYENSKVTKADLSDTMSLGLATDARESYSANEDENGRVIFNNSLALVTIDKNGKITSCTLDGVRADVEFDKRGKILSDIESSVLSKNRQMYDYGMKEASAIGREWFEEASDLAGYVVGMKKADISRINLDSEGCLKDVDIEASVTFHVNEYIIALGKALQRVD